MTQMRPAFFRNLHLISLFKYENLTTVADNVFDQQNNFHEDRLSFPVYGEKINLGPFKTRDVRQFCMGNLKKLIPR